MAYHRPDDRLFLRGLVDFYTTSASRRGSELPKNPWLRFPPRKKLTLAWIRASPSRLQANQFLWTPQVSGPAARHVEDHK